jgi:hypothetical protein
LAGLTALTYVFGLLALWVPISRTYTHHLITAWHAVSLVPRPVVAGLGVGQLLAVPTLFLAGVIVLLKVGANSINYALQRWGERALWWIVGIFSVILTTAVIIIIAQIDITNLPRAWYVLYAAILLALLIQVRRYFIPENGHEPRRWVPFAVFVVVLYAGSAMNVALSAPPLPPIEVSATTPTTGKLLTHTDGFRYVFDQEGDLIAIPDDEVTTVRLPERSD